MSVMTDNESELDPNYHPPFRNPFELDALGFVLTPVKRQLHESIMRFASAEGHILKMRHIATMYGPQYALYFFEPGDKLSRENRGVKTQTELLDFLVDCQYPPAVVIKRQQKLKKYIK